MGSCILSSDGSPHLHVDGDVFFRQTVLTKQNQLFMRLMTEGYLKA